MLENLFFVLEMALVGVGVGVLSGALGLGGGIIMVPAFMTFLGGMDAHTAKGTSLFTIIFVSLVNAWLQHSHEQRSPWRLAALLALGSILGGYVGAYVTSLLSEGTVVMIFLSLLVIIAVRTFLLEPKPVDESEVKTHPALAILIGMVAGLVGGATGTGGGLILVPLALMAGIVSNARVVLLSNMVMVATSTAGTIAHLTAPPLYDRPFTVGLVYLPLAPLVFVGAQVGSTLGRRMNRRMTLGQRRAAMGVLLIAIAIRMLLQLIHIGQPNG